MISNAITCFGDELLTVCADLRQRGMVIQSLDAMVSKPSGWRVHYFERVGETEVRGTPLAVQAPGALTQSPHQAEIPANDIALVAVNGEVAPRDPLNGSKIPCQDPAFITEPAKLARNQCAETVGVENSIQYRLSALQSRLASSGKLKPSTRTKSKHARLPYCD